MKQQSPAPGHMDDRLDGIFIPAVTYRAIAGILYRDGRGFVKKDRRLSMKKIRFALPKVIGSSSVHPC